MKLGEELKDMEGTEDVEFTVSAGASGAPKEDSCLILLECRGGARLSDACGGAERRLRDGDSVRFCEKEVSVPCAETEDGLDTCVVVVLTNVPAASEPPSGGALPPSW